MSKLTTAPRDVFQTFMNFPLVDDLDTLKADVAIIGMPYGDPYTIDELINDQTNAPTAVRRASQRISQALDRYDFDIGGPVFDGKDIKVVDVGDVPGAAADHVGHYGRAEAAIRKIRAAGALPITIGGDHGIPIPIFRALDGEGPITLVQLDAHLDWRDNVNGVKEGYSSTIRRASEMTHIKDIFQVGVRGQGSARIEEVEAARAYGANIITTNEWQDIGTAALLKRIPDGGRYYLTIDADGLDPAVMPAVEGPQPGGVSYRQTIELIKGLVGKGKLVGMDIVEIAPARDVNEITSMTAGHIILNVIGAAVRAGYFKR
ncbi:MULTISPECIES: agmatinase [unclassified Mesorhizobium]|uniref:agmatinase n=1 Tax=unclassified Mesorhizobium TaxID=325217 RepID=UPI00112A0E1E|nr:MULTISPECIES: agmatinase [unclassified Mesorhizobium]TPK45717.1 arginase [Mesorhizobium sp. B2-5-2]TPL16097.1 arginase [Mesorhizobium sp. B2-4-7]TPL16374.1 arginase [Mesorhizobium sp. B2-4-9]TPL32438.1 arginase [Mesorhizobium sp. B2-4-5]TPM68004.1 arginase [Mesorhizobium sp. B2-1-6]